MSHYQHRIAEDGTYWRLVLNRVDECPYCLDPPPHAHRCDENGDVDDLYPYPEEAAA